MNKNLEGAKRKGREAKKRGLSRDDCPYRDKRTVRGHITYSRAFIRAWLEGYDEDTTD